MSSMNGNPSDQPNVAWERLPWKKLEVTVYRMQKRIFQASKRGDTKTVHKIQKLLMKSEAARLLAVRRVTQDNQGKKTAGVDGVKSVPPAERLKMVEAIHPKQMENRKPKPLRRVWIPKPGKEEKRPLGIPIWAVHYLSFQAMFGIPCVFLLVDRSSRSTVIVLLYHKLRCITSPSLLPLPSDWLAQCCDDLRSECNPAWSQRRGTNTLQDARLAPVCNG
jgi:N-terminal domain of reverse transcriptase